MECLNEYIGLKSCSSQPESGLYINGLPGMSTELADNIANSEQVTFSGVWNDVKERAFLRLKDDIVSYMYSDKTNMAPVNFSQIIYQTKRLKKANNSQEIPLENVYRGVYIRLPETRYVEAFLKELYVFSDRSVETEVFVFDINDSSILFSKEISLTKGLNTIAIDHKFSMRYQVLELFIGVDCSEFSTTETYLENYYWYDSDLQCACGDDYDQTLYISPATLGIGEDATRATVKRVGKGQGVAIGADIGCSIEGYICENKEALKRAIWYLLGCEMLMQKIGSPRLNFFTASNIEQTNYLMNIFSGNYKSALKKAIDTIPVNNSLCFDCGDGLADIGHKGIMP